jgi:hypothetical protein
MKRDDIIAMAREAGLPILWITETGVIKWADLERFTALVAEAERNGLKRAAECFRMCEHKGVCDEKAKSNETS